MNKSYNETQASEPSINFEEIQGYIDIVVPVFFGLIAIIGLFGNVLVVLVVILNQQMRSTTNLLIGNMAASDILFVLFCVPFTAVDYVAQKWPFGVVWCQMVQYLIIATVHASIYTLVLMSVDRFLAVVYPVAGRYIRTEYYTKLAIGIIWLIVTITSIPVALLHGLQEFDMNGKRGINCQFIDGRFLSQATYQVIFFSTSYLLPLITISALYLRMIERLWKTVVGLEVSKESKKGRKRVTRLVVIVVIAFALLWLPIQVILMLKSFGLYKAHTNVSVFGQVIAHTLAYSSSCINPILYAFFSRNFRKAFWKVMSCTSKQQRNCDHIPLPQLKIPNSSYSTDVTNIENAAL